MAVGMRPVVRSKPAIVADAERVASAGNNVRHLRPAGVSDAPGADILDLGITIAADPVAPRAEEQERKRDKKAAEDDTAATVMARLSQPVNIGFLSGVQRFLVKNLMFGRKAKMDLFKALVSYARMKTPATRALENIFMNQSEEGRKPNNPIAYVVRDWRYNVTEKGMPLGTAGAEWLSKEEVVLINAGAGTPKFLDSLESCMFIMENKGKIAKELRKAFVGPVMSLATALGLPVVFVDYLLPAIKVMPNFRLNATEAQIAAVGKFISTDWYLVLAGLIATVAGVLISMPRLTGRLRARLDKIPPWGFYRVLQGSNFMLTIAALTSSGIGMTESMRKIGENRLSPYMRERVGRTLGFMEQGEKLGTALWRTQLDFPDKRTVQNLKSFENDVEFNRIISEMAREAIETNTEIIAKQSKIMATVIGLFAAYVMVTFMSAIQAVMVSASSMH